MSETTKTPRAHAEMAIKFYSDAKMKCRRWRADGTWDDILCPNWYWTEIYEVCEHRPTHKPRKRVTMAGITFDAPETEAPKMGAKYWLADVESTYEFEWRGNPIEQRWLAAGLVHLDYESARLHAQALHELNRQLCGLGDVQ